MRIGLDQTDLAWMRWVTYAITVRQVLGLPLARLGQVRPNPSPEDRIPGCITQGWPGPNLTHMHPC